MDQLADMAPGQELATLLARLDRSTLSGYDLVTLLKARSRQLAHEQAEVYADMVAVADRISADTADMATVCNSDIPKFAAAEISAALACTKRSARNCLENAWLIVERLPQVWEALRAGLIDTPKAKVFAMETRVLDEPTARRVSAELLPEAPGLTTGQLGYRLRRLVLDADPNAAKNNYDRGVDERAVIHRTNPDGTGTLSAYGLPVERAAAAYERIDGIARAAKHGGDGRPMDQIRSDAYLSLLEGAWTGPAPVARRGILELTCDLPTLMGLADRPADLDGWGPVIADIARQVAAATTAEPGDTIWRFSVTDPISGRLLHHGTTRARPATPGKDARPRRNSRLTVASGDPPALRDRPGKDPRRTLNARDKAYVIARDRTCRGPGCRTPARRSEIDHIIEHARGGRSEPWNADCKCGYCHDLKDGGWSVTRDTFGHTRWTSRLGHHYTVPPEPITPPATLGPLEHHLFTITRMRT